MKKRITFFVVLAFIIMVNTSLFAQATHTVDFEPAGVGAGWDWTLFEFAPTFTEIANPVSGGINTSANVVEFVAHVTDQPWVGCWTEDDGEFTFDATNSLVKIMVYKPLSSEVHFRVEGGTGAPTELTVSNTSINTWEELTFDFSTLIGQTYSRIVIYPDFNFARTVDQTLYFDNIQVPDGVVVPPLAEPTTAPAIPTHLAADVISIYSEAYTNLPGTDFNPNWGQSTTVTVDYVAAGNNTLKYEGLNYQGTQYANQDVSGYEFLHVDFWTPNSTALDFFLISPSGETPYTLSITTETWVSVDIPLTTFVAPVNLADVFQFKVAGNGTVYFDNWYFWKTPIVSGTDATLSDLQVDGSTVPGFLPLTENYTYGLVEGTVVVPQITTATPTDPNVNSVIVTQAPAIPGDATVVVTAEDGLTTKTYTVSYAITTPNSVPPIPTQAPVDVISMFSDTYTDVSVDTWRTGWSDATLEDVSTAGNPVKKYSLLNFVGIETTGANLIDVTSMTHIHMDIWTPDANDFKIKLVDFGGDSAWGGGDDTEHELIFAAPVTATWISYDIPLTDFVNLSITGNMAQYILSKGPLGTIYLDNMYFYTDTPVPVTLSSFTAIFDNSTPTLQWTTQSESNNLGWNIYRSLSENMVQANQINDLLIPGNGTTSEPTDYVYNDLSDIESNTTYWYWLESASYNGETELYGPVTLTIQDEENQLPELPTASILHNNYPNPFNPSTMINFSISQGETGSLTILNAKGQVMESHSYEAGEHQFNWDATQYSSGIYFYKLETQNYTNIKKMIMMK